MRAALCAAFLLIATSDPATQERDAAAILKQMRAALGGDAALDAVKALSLEGPMTSTYNRQSIQRHSRAPCGVARPLRAHRSD